MRRSIFDVLRPQRASKPPQPTEQPRPYRPAPVGEVVHLTDNLTGRCVTSYVVQRKPDGSMVAEPGTTRWATTVPAGTKADWKPDRYGGPFAGWHEVDDCD